MRKSKHFRKDVIIARIIAAAICIVIIILISSLVSALTKSDDDKDIQKPQTENSQSIVDSEPKSEIDEDVQQTVPSESEGTSESETTSESENTERYVVTTAQVKFRSEPNTNCTVIGYINSGVKVVLLEEVQGWYKVSYDGKEGYISADYSRIVE